MFFTCKMCHLNDLGLCMGADQQAWFNLNNGGNNMVELDYNNPEHKTMCEEIILAKRLKRIQYYSTYGKGTFFTIGALN